MPFQFKILGYFVAMLAATVPIKSWAVSFDCKNASTVVERLICSDGELGAVDDAMAAAYKQALAGMSEKDILVRYQQAWLKNERGACRDRACIKKVYSDRIEELRSWNQGVANTKDYFGIYVIKHETLIYNGDRDRWEPMEAEDCLALTPDGDNSVKFSFVLIGMNGHECQMDGTATLVGDHFEFRPTPEPYLEEQNECLLRIRVKKHSILLEDDELNCRQVYCGARAGIDGREFDRKQKVDKAQDASCNAFSKEIQRSSIR
jgi:uncharacterized protein YecT (DUF1311 family)